MKSKKGFILFEVIVVLLIESILILVAPIIIKHTFFEDIKKRIDFVYMMDTFVQAKYHSIDFKKKNSRVIVAGKIYFIGNIFLQLPYTQYKNYAHVYQFFNFMMQGPGGTIYINDNVYLRFSILPVTSAFSWGGIKW
ncbi:hypothetical protein Marpi_1375 [Marinitoga piezophila KA3]|uniref:Uncharacterized protein n=1 Tax=Marinitoga piezophila (strain DSM 14283 / JCM 11233 / KA3) TaxID=443254 RepID=H2J3F9_MARPK|nr:MULTISPECIES: hypothetical protein [Marinitoga]AEX85775.1 hypothetical protein Marpi_1375 [Marinitoga piezophila KA3]APT76217.1 hypothetical protein LN42_07345 [Marinitoga sp. 1137]